MPASRPLWARIARYLLIAIAVLLLLCGVSAIAVPLLIDHVVLARAGEAIGRQVSIERIRFNPFTLALSARGIRIADEDPANDFVTVEQARADLSISSIRYLAPVIDGLTIVAPRIRVQRTGEHRFNFSDIVERLKAAPAEPDPNGEPARFALHNLELTGGEIRVDDRVLQQQHRVRDLRIGVPFLSNLNYAADITVQPALSALVNDSPLSLAGESVPFSETRQTSLDVVLSDLDIATYLRLSPVPLAFTVPKGKLGTDLKIRFAQEAGVAKLAIAGAFRIDDLQIDARDGRRLVLAKRIALGLEQVEPLAGRYAFGELDVEGLDMAIERGADGNFPLARAFAVETEERKAHASAPKTPAGATTPGGASTAADQVQWSIRKTSVKGARATFTDKTVSPAVELVHSDIAIELAEIGNRQAAAAAGSLSLAQNESSRVSWQGELDVGKSRASGELSATVAGIAAYQSYLAGSVKAAVQAQTIAAQARVDLGWAEGFSLEVADAKASVQKASIRLPDDEESAVAFGRLAAEGVAVSLGERKATVSRLALDDADIRVERNAKGQLNLQRILTTAQTNEDGGSAQPATDAGKEAAPGETPAWTVRIDRIDLDRNAVTWHDLTAPKPVSVPVTQLAGRIEQVGTDLSLASTLDLKARVGRSGNATARGEFVIAPWSMQLAVQLQRLALPSVDPYVAERLTLGIDEGTLSTSGQLSLAGDRVRYRGRLEVDGLRTRERTTSTQAIRWRKLLLEGIDVDVDPATLGPDDRIAIGGVTLSDFFARVLLSEQGRFNLQDIVRTEAASGPARSGPKIRLGTIKLQRGSSNFTDRFVRPNYSVNLTDLNGSLSAMASDNPAPSDVGLTGRIDSDAPIDISGKINPLASTLYADIRAEAKGIDLPKLSPYSAKYAGYAIEKGKLSLDVHYKIENEQLVAQNRVLLDQLTLGEKIEGPDATSLPIQFALGLLKNSKGEIDVSLPIAGSLDDPQFSIGGVIGKAIANLFTRVITAPFSALASAFGGAEEELSFVEFKPGTAELTDESVKRLGTIAKALTERPALKLEVAGRVDPKSENDAIERQRLEARLRALKRRQAGGGDAAGEEPAEPVGQAGQSQAGQSQGRQEAPPAPARVTISKEEYPVLLKQLYEDTKLPDKPRNALGLAKTLEVAEMEKLLLGAIEVDAEAVRRLALRRAQVVRDWLATRGRISGDRMFTLAPRTNTEMTGPNQSKPQCPAHCAEFSLR